jgi:hypothetical protein
MSAHPLTHRCHDYKHLMVEWRALARRCGLQMRSFAEAEGWPVYYLESPRKRFRREAAWHYISAGVHGDEAAPPWALLEWAQESVERMRAEPFLIFPALNPVGLILNTRVDGRGVDINRAFNDPGDPLIRAWREVVGERKLAVSLCLHEDYDGQGCYVYELTRRSSSIGADILRDTSKIIPTDPRKKIDGRQAKHGVIMRRVPPDLPGHPEAIVLHYLGAPATLTFESPSEFSLTDRIAVQRRFIESALEHGRDLD